MIFSLAKYTKRDVQQNAQVSLLHKNKVKRSPYVFHATICYNLELM